MFTDTDSLCYQVHTEDFYHDIELDLDLFDSADYPSYHTLHSTVNKKVIGKFNNNNNNKLILILRAFHEMIKHALHDFYL